MVTASCMTVSFTGTPSLATRPSIPSTLLELQVAQKKKLVYLEQAEQNNNTQSRCIQLLPSPNLLVTARTLQQQLCWSRWNKEARLRLLARSRGGSMIRAEVLLGLSGLGCWTQAVATLAQNFLTHVEQILGVRISCV